MRTLSARILLGFAALTVTFGVITATVVFNMQQVEDQVLVIGKGFVPLALASKDLARRQDDLRNYLEEGLQDESNIMVAKVGINRARNNRDRELKAARKILDAVIDADLVRVDPVRLAQIKPRIESFEQLRNTLDEMYKQLLEAPPFGPKDTWSPKQAAASEVLQKLRTEERKLMIKSNGLSDQLDQAVQSTSNYLQRSQRTVRVWTIYLGLVAVLLGLCITVWVVITLRPLRRLRDGARRIAAGDYASRIPERGPSEVADLAREFNSMGRAVEERERELVRSERLVAVGKMAAMITHEIRNPLSSIVLNTELLEDEFDGKDAEEGRDLCRAIHREADRLTAITEDYLAFARLPKPKLAPEPINPIVAGLANFVKEDLATKKVVLTTELCAEHVIGMVDASQLRQCLINLVRNATDAVTASLKDRASGNVILRTRRDGERIAIEVTDDGVGIPTEALPRLFDPFFSTKEGGNGLGLALTHEIVREHHGDLEAQSTVGRGTTFTLRVPIQAT